MKGTQKRRAVHPLCWILIIVCLLAGIAGVITISILYTEKSKLPFNYGIGVDSGSSKTVFYVYQWPTDKENGTGIAKQIYTCPSGSDKKLPPLANFALNPSDAGSQVIKPCMDKILGIVPSTDYSTTPVLVGATAGMRILNVTNSSAAEAIMSSVRQTLSTYPFNFSQPLRQARVIEGNEEGSFGWITSNYLSGSFGVQPNVAASSKTEIGALDMGGASTQLTFDPGHVMTDPNYAASFHLYGSTYDVYTHSYLCYGLDEANRRYKAMLVQLQNFSQTVDDPCAPAGNQTQMSFSSVFQLPCSPPPANLPDDLQAADALQDIVFTFRGTSDPLSCQSITRTIFDFSADCPVPPCTFDGVYQPPLAGEFYAFSGFYFAANDLGLKPATNRFSLDEYRQAMNSFCNLTWDQLSKRTTNPSILVILCFQAQHIHHILIDGYGFNETSWSSINFVQNINGSDFGWVLGMIINTTNVIPPHAYTTGVSSDVFVIIVVISASLVLVSLAMAIAAILFQRASR